MRRPIVGVTDAEIFGKRVRELHEKSGLSQEKLAQASNLTTGFVSTIESGKKTPSLTAILKLGTA
jgi:transcriptional regulator with XRE-family HTH domain